MSGSAPHDIASLVPLASIEASTFGRDFQWPLPERFNVAEAVCLRHADGQGRLALLAEDIRGDCVEYTFDDLARQSGRLAFLLQHLGIDVGDRVAVILPQRVETALMHLAAHRLGAISLPLSVMFGVEALSYRLENSGSKVVMTDAEHVPRLLSIVDELPELAHIICVDALPDTLISEASRSRLTVIDLAANLQSLADEDSVEGVHDTHRDDPAFLLYTSGTTGPPKGALIPHRALIGNLTGFELSHNGFPVMADRMFTPADWAWTGGLLDALLPAWYYGIPVVALEQRGFDAEKVASLMSRHRVTCAFIPPTALKLMRAVPDLFDRHPHCLRSVMSAGEALGEELYSWGEEVLGLSINEMCGQTEHNYLMGNCSAVLAVRPGSMGKVYPGHRVAIMGADEQLLDDDEVGEIVVHRDDPVHFLGYWRRPEATLAKYSGDWFHTGDVGRRDAQGYLWFLGRDDDVINSAGFRIGPGEIENCALKHADVMHVAAIGVPDPEGVRGDVVKLCVVLRDGVNPGDDVRDALQQRIRQKLAAYEYPRLVEFLESLPMTTTGKIQRGELRRAHGDSLTATHPDIGNT